MSHVFRGEAVADKLVKIVKFRTFRVSLFEKSFEVYLFRTIFHQVIERGSLKAMLNVPSSFSDSCSNPFWLASFVLFFAR